MSGDFAIALARGGSVVLSTDDLSGRDVVSGVAALRFAVSDPLNGFVALASAPGVAITSFTQAQLAAGEVLFRHDGSATTTGSFSVVLRDAAGNATQPRTVLGSVTAVDTPLGAVGDADAADDMVVEGAGPGTTVGLTARAIDPDPGDTVTYILSDSAGGRFAIDARSGVVTVAGALDSETAASHRITVQATSSGGDSRSVDFTIAVANVDDPLGAVSDVDTAPNRVAENAAIGTVVGLTARALDPDTNDRVTYALTDSAGGRFAIDSATGVVTVAGALDFETFASHQIAVRATSSGGDSQSLAFFLQVQDIVERVAINGTAAKDRLLGTAADDVFASGAGNDAMTGRGGHDLFLFGTESLNGLREIDRIGDFRAGDLLDLGDATIVREIHFGGSTRLILSGDGDQILLAGLADFDPTTMLLA